MPDFSFFVNCERDEELVKGERKRLLRGVASTESKDKHGEELVVPGMDFAPYLEKGHLNYDHMKGIQHILGKPLEAKIVPDGSTLKKSIKGPAFYHLVELYDTEPGRAAWDLLQAEKDDPNRNHGFSVEGAILETEANRLTKTRVDDVALTPKPANTDTFAEFLAKSLTTENAEPLLHQNLDNGRVTGDQAKALTGVPMDEILWGKCSHNCYDHKGRFRKGAQSAYFHLVMCKGVAQDEAYRLVKGLQTANYLK